MPVTTYTAPCAASTFPARMQEKGMFAVVATYEASAVAIDDIIQMFKVPAGCTVLGLRVIFDDLGTDVTLDIGDGADTDRYFNNLDVATAAGNGTYSGLPVTYADEDTIDIVVAGGAATGTITLVAYLTRESVDLT